MSFIFYANFVVNGEPTGLKVLYDSKYPTKDTILLTPKAKLEINKAYTAEFSMLPNHYLYNRMTRFTTLIYIVYCDRLIFRGRVIDIKPDFEMKKQISCESDINFLLDNIVYPKAYSSTGFSNLISNPNRLGPYPRQDDYGLLDTFNDGYTSNPNWIGWGGVENYKKFTLGNVTVSYDGVSADSGSIQIDQSKKTDTLGDILRNELVNVYGGILTTRTENFGTPAEAHYLDYLADPYQSDQDTPENTQGIKFGVNMLNFTIESDSNEVFSRLIPLTSDGQNIATLIDGRATYISVPALEARYGIIYKPVKFEKGSNGKSTLAEANKYIALRGKVWASAMSVKALDFRVFDGSVDEIKMGEKVLAYSEPHGLNEVLYCLSIEYDFLNPDETTYNIGPFIPQYTGKAKDTGSRRNSVSVGDPTTKTMSVSQAEAIKFTNEMKYSTLDEAFKETNGVFTIVQVTDAHGNVWDTFGIKSGDSGVSTS